MSRFGPRPEPFVSTTFAAALDDLRTRLRTHGRSSKVVSLLMDSAAHGADPANALDVIVARHARLRIFRFTHGPPLNSIAVAGLWA